jgi:hypothetical protein
MYLRSSTVGTALPRLLSLLTHVAAGRIGASTTMIAADTTAPAVAVLAPMRPAATCVRRDKSRGRVPGSCSAKGTNGKLAWVAHFKTVRDMYLRSSTVGEGTDHDRGRYHSTGSGGAGPDATGGDVREEGQEYLRSSTVGTALPRLLSLLTHVAAGRIGASTATA